MSKLDTDLRDALRTALMREGLVSDDFNMAPAHLANLATDGVYLPLEAAIRLRAIAEVLRSVASDIDVRRFTKDSAAS